MILKLTRKHLSKCKENNNILEKRNFGAHSYSGVDDSASI